MDPMIGRLWRGRCTPENAEAYETLLITKIIPELDQAEGCLGAYVMRRQDGQDIEFVVLHLFESLAAVKAFAGDNYQVAAVPGEARALLTSFDPVAQHFDVRAAPNHGSTVRT
jgi:quinol monooxygenase YgiN